jgi:hypothetical protein
VVCWPFVLGCVAHLRPDRLVVRRVAGPRLQHAQVEVEAVHLGTHEFVIDALFFWPGGRVERGQPRLVDTQFCLLASERGGGVIGRAVAQRRTFECLPFAEETDEILVGARGIRGCGQQKRRRQQQSGRSAIQDGVQHRLTCT